MRKADSNGARSRGTLRRAPQRSRLLRGSLVPALLLAAVACGGDTTAPPGEQPPGSSVPASALSFVPLGRNAPSLVSNTASFWARVGEDRILRMYYRPRAGRTDSTEFLRFRVRKKSLLRRPDGTSFGPNDSLQITLRVTDPTSLVVEFSPAGLLFDPSDPADLKLSFHERNGDLNDDGKSDASDATVLSRIAIWKQESAGLPWVKLLSNLVVGADEIEAKLTGFTSYAIAY